MGKEHVMLPKLDSEHFKQMAFRASERSHRDPYRAEIFPGVRPEWHVLLTHPSAERTAAGHLIGRRFGTYLPEFSRRLVMRGRRRWQTLPIFRGYLFLFVWDIARHWRRIENCTGIAGFLHSIEGTPLIIGDGVMNEIQALETNLLIHEGRLCLPSEESKRSRRGRKHRLAKWQDELEVAHGAPVLSTKSYFAGFAELNDTERNSLLHKALGL